MEIFCFPIKDFSTHQSSNVVNAWLMLACQHNTCCFSCYQSKFPIQRRVLKTMAWVIIKCYCWECFKSPWWKFRNTHFTIFKCLSYSNIFEWPQLIDFFNCPHIDLDISYANKLLSKACLTKYLRTYVDTTVWENSY